MGQTLRICKSNKFGYMLCGCLENTKYPSLVHTFTLGLKKKPNKTKNKTTSVVPVLNLLVLL